MWCFACEKIFARTRFFFWVIARCSVILRVYAPSRGGLRTLLSRAGRPAFMHRWVSG